jgi:hypothetical protein
MIRCFRNPEFFIKMGLSNQWIFADYLSSSIATHANNLDTENIEQFDFSVCISALIVLQFDLQQPPGYCCALLYKWRGNQNESQESTVLASACTFCF